MDTIIKVKTPAGTTLEYKFRQLSDDQKQRVMDFAKNLETRNNEATIQSISQNPN